MTGNDTSSKPFSGTGSGTRSTVWRRLLQQRVAAVALCYLVILGAAAMLAPWLTSYAPDVNNYQAALQGPSGNHLLGTDQYGRDLLTRVLFASRTALLAGLESVGVGLVIGVPVGLLVGYLGGWWDRIVMRLVDALMSLPGLVVAIAVIAALGAGLVNAMLAVGLLFAVQFTRLVRGEVLSVREELYVEAATISGAPRHRVLSRYVLPNVAAPIIVQAALYIGIALLIEAILSFLGLGVQPPDATWGTIIADARDVAAQNPWQPVPAGLALTLTVLAFNLIADGVRDSLGRGSAGAARQRSRGTLPATVPRAEPEAGAVLSVRGLTVSVDQGRGAPGDLLRGVDLDVHRGETVGLVGESGSGKSLTALSLMGLLPPGVSIVSGSIRLADNELVGRSEAELQPIRGQRISMVFQDPVSALNPALTVGRQLMEPLQIHRGLDRTAARKEAEELLARVQVPRPRERMGHHPHQFSGGMAQRVVIAMALACQPELLIADEPTTALDVTTQEGVLDLLRDLQHEMNIGILFITHDMGVVADICDRACVMYAGEIVEVGAVDPLFACPAHPYTQALLAATPRHDQSAGSLPTIPGRVPRPDEIPRGCAFQDRCPLVLQECRNNHPPLQHMGDARQARCLRAEEQLLLGARK